MEVVKILIAKGAAADRSFEDLFFSAVFKGHTEMVKALMVESDRIKDDTLNRAYMLARHCDPELFNVIAKALNKEQF